MGSKRRNSIGMKKLLLLLPLVALTGCGSSEPLTPENVSDWPFIQSVNEATIQCSAGEPAYADINGELYALNGAAKARKPTTNFLNHDTGLFAPHPDPALANLGMKAYLTSFNKVAESRC